MVAYLNQAGVQYLIAQIRNILWPVGTILATSSNTSPASYIGGSWEAYAPGRTLVGVDDTDADFALGKGGGSKTHNHKAGDELIAGINIGTDNLYLSMRNSAKVVETNAQWIGGHGGNTSPIGHARGTRMFGHTDASSSIQPYIAVHYWRRIA